MMQKIKDEIIDFFKNASPGFWVKWGFIVAMFIVLVVMYVIGGVNGRTSENTTNNTSNAPRVTEKADSAKNDNAQETATPAPSYAPITPDPTAKADGHGDTWNVDKDKEGIKIDSTKAVECTTSDIDQKISDIMNQDGRFETDTTTDYVKRDLSYYADTDPAYSNLYSYSGTVSYSRDTTVEVGGSEIEKDAGDTAYLLAYVSQDGDNAVIHKLTIDGTALIDDGTVPEDAATL